MEYNTDEVSGFMIVDGVKQYRYHNNHRTNAEEVNLLGENLNLLKQVMGMGDDAGANEEEITAAEKRLGIKIPEALKTFYRIVGADNRVYGSPMQKDKMLRPHELFVDRGVLVYYVIGKNKFMRGIDLEKLRIHYNNAQSGWEYYSDDFSLWQNIMVNAYVFAIGNAGTTVYSRLKGMSNWPPHNIAIERFKEFLKPVPHFKHNGHILMYSIEHQLLGWFRGGQFIQDICIGCPKKATIDAFVERYELTKANYKLIDGEVQKPKKKPKKEN